MSLGPSAAVVLVDDDLEMRSFVREALESHGHRVQVAGDGVEALEILREHAPDVVLTDLEMPRCDGLEVVTRGKVCCPETTFIVMTAFGTVGGAVEAIKAGAEQFLTKPVDLRALEVLIGRALQRGANDRETAELREELRGRRALPGVIGEHPSMLKVAKIVAKVAPTHANVLIVGESGTGKELIASALHTQSKRADQPFIRLNCAALAETVLESELFGHEKGAFTGASRRRDGRFSQADGGTLFLDEISEVPLPLQVKLLRFLQEREFERVGGEETLRVDVRVVAATNRPLKPLVEDGLFRDDLFYRLDVVQIEVPPLRARASDIPRLADHFLRQYAEENDVRITGFTSEAIERLCAYGWPGNVRELENTIERAVVLCEGERIGIEELGSHAEHAGADSLSELVGLPLSEVERLLIERTLVSTGGSTAEAAKILGISQRKIQYRQRQWNGEATDDSESPLPSGSS